MYRMQNSASFKKMTQTMTTKRQAQPGAPESSEAGPAILIEGLHKRFPKTSGYRDIVTFWKRKHTVALQGVDLSIPAGNVFGLLGPNGAGKTTLMKIISGLVLPDAGTVRIDDYDIVKDPNDVKDYLSYVSGEERSLYWRLTGRQNMQFFASLYEVPKKQRDENIDKMLSLVGLLGAANERVGNYSSGMKQRLSIARGLLTDPDILLLDEPTRSLDPLSARDLHRFIQDDLVTKHHKTVILATHNMEEAALLCREVAIINDGRIRACGSVDSILDQLTVHGRCVLTVDGDAIAVEALLSSTPGVMSVERELVTSMGGETFSLTLDNPLQNVPVITEKMVQSGARVLEIRHVKPSLVEAISHIAEEDNGSL